MNCCLQNYTTHQFTYFDYYLFQDKFKYPKIIKIIQVHEDFLLATHLNLMRLKKSD